MAKTQGVQVYEILPDGCLNGTYANDDTGNKIYNEIARKRTGDTTDIIGLYDCFYFDLGNTNQPCELEIKLGSTSQYEFIWRTADKEIFKGQGWKANQHQVMLKYQSV